MAKILGIVPYPEMKELVSKVASERNDIEADIYVGDYRDCIRILEENLSKNFEAILSRGATADELKKRIHYIPVVDIPVSAFDLIAAVRLAKSSGGSFAAVVFPSLAAELRKLKDLTKDDFPVYSVSSEKETVEVLKSLKAEGCGMVLCGAVAYEHASLMGMPSILITSGRDCISRALDDAVQYARYNQKIHEELYFYKNILRAHERQTVILQEDGQILFTTESYPLAETLCGHSRKEIRLAAKYGKCSFYKVLDDTRYSVDCEKTEYDGRPCFTLMFVRTKIPVRIDRHGITYTDLRTIKTEVAASILPRFFNDEDLRTLQTLSRSRSPILITGESDCYKSIIAEYLYVSDTRKAAPLIIIDFAALDITGWQFLMANDHSPLNENGCTVLVKNVAFLDGTKRMAFLNCIQQNLFCRRNRVIFVHTAADDPDIVRFVSQLVQKTYSQIFEVPPLRKRLSALGTFLSADLNRKNQASGEHVTEADPEVYEVLQSYHWPYNYKQLERVMERLYDSAADGKITREMAEAALQAEELLEVKETGRAREENGQPRIDYSRPLDEITRSVVLHVLDECGGNQRAAARRLQISRTTLWRMLKEAEEQKHKLP